MNRARFVTLLLLLALAVRLPMLYFLRDVYLTGGITTSMGLVARNLLEGRGLTETTGPESILRLYDLQLAEGRLHDIQEFPDPPDQPTSPLIQRMPGYPALLALIWKLTGSYRYLPVQVVQILLSSLLPLLIYGTARRYFGETSGRVAGILAAVNIAEARLAVVPLYDWWILFTAGIVLWLLSLAMERGFPLRGFALIGGVFAVGVYFKSTLIIVPFFLALCLVPQIGWRRSSIGALLLAGLPLLALAPWMARNDRIFHRSFLTNTFFWASIWEGFGEVPNPFNAYLDDRRTYLTALLERRDLVYGSPAYDDYFRAKVLRVYEERPGFVATLWLGRLWRGLISPANPWGLAGADRPEMSYTNFRLETGGSPFDYLRHRPGVAFVKILQRCWDPLLISLALVTLVMEWRRWREFLPLLALPLAFLAVTIPIHLEGRYLLPGSLVLILFASVPVAAWMFPGRGNRTTRPDPPPRSQR
jgi:4-amino-4-deoxy-L-arabinose transferase and related glycosyltransferases of PMT family